MQCAECGWTYREARTSKVFLNKYIKKDVEILQCEKCGHELMDLDKIEEIYQEIRRKEQTNILLKPLIGIFARAKVLTSGYVLF
jgi:Zn ribbon nucleic-acid-binding protein